MPDSVLQPAPVSTTRRLALEMKSARFMKVWSAVAAATAFVCCRCTDSTYKSGGCGHRTPHSLRLAGEPHAEGDRVRQALGVGAAAGDGRLFALAGGARVDVHQALDDLGVRVEAERLVEKVRE